MTAKKGGVICGACNGYVRAPGRKITLEQARKNHQESCPAIPQPLKEK